jgi:hypothetical protein
MTQPQTICSSCKAVIHDGPLDEHGLYSHGICPACARNYFPARKPRAASPAERVTAGGLR